MKRSLFVGFASVCIAVLLVISNASLPAAGKPSACPADIPVNVWVALNGDPVPPESLDGGTTIYQAGAGENSYNLVPDAKGWYTSGKGSANVDARFQLGNCTGDLSINLSGRSRTLTAYLPAADKGSLSVWWIIFDKAWGTPTPADRPPTGITPLGLTEGPQAAGDAADAEDHLYWRRTMGSMGNDVTNNDSRLPMKPDAMWNLSSLTSYIRVYHPTVDMWVMAPELRDSATGPDWIADLVRLKNTGVVVSENLQSYPFKIVVCKQTATPETCDVSWPY